MKNEINEHTIVRVLDVKERIDQTCHFCGETRSVKYIISGAIDTDGTLIDHDVACCNRCVLNHVWAGDI